MSSPLPKDSPDVGPVSTVKLREISDTIDSQVKTLDSIINALNFQLLGNVDAISESSSLSEDRETLKTLCENMIKKPFRRQVGRLKGVRRILQELSTKCEG